MTETRKQLAIAVCLTGVLGVMGGCSVTRNIPVSMQLSVPEQTDTKQEATAFLVMTEEQCQHKVIHQPNSLHDYFTFPAGESIKSNLLHVLATRFEDVQFAHDAQKPSISPVDYVITPTLQNCTVNMTLADWSVEMALDYEVQGSQDTPKLEIQTIARSTNAKSGGAKAFTVIAPALDFVSGGLKRDEERLGVAWDMALADSLSQFLERLDVHLETDGK